MHRFWSQDQYDTFLAQGITEMFHIGSFHSKDTPLLKQHIDIGFEPWQGSNEMTKKSIVQCQIHGMFSHGGFKTIKDAIKKQSRDDP